MASKNNENDNQTIDQIFEKFLKNHNIRENKDKKKYVSALTPIVTFERTEQSIRERNEKYMSMKHVTKQNEKQKRKIKSNFNYDIKPFVKAEQYLNNRPVQECVPMDLVYIDEHTCRFNMERDNRRKVDTLDLYSLDLHAHCIESARTKMLYLFKLSYERNLGCLIFITGQGPTLKGAVEKLLTQDPFKAQIKNFIYDAGKFIVRLK